MNAEWKIIWLLGISCFFLFISALGLLLKVVALQNELRKRAKWWAWFTRQVAVGKNITEKEAGKLL